MGSDQEVIQSNLSESEFEAVSDAVITAVANSVPEGVYGIILLSNNGGRVSVRTNFPHDPCNVTAAIGMLREAAENLEKVYAGQRPTTGDDRGDTDVHRPKPTLQDYGPADPEAD